MSDNREYSPGLEGVIAGESDISRIDAKRNRLIIRGYDLVELTTCTFEEVAHLLLCGALPDSIQLDAFISQLRADRSLPGGVIELMRRAPGDAHPMALLRTAVSALGLHDQRDAGCLGAVRVVRVVRLVELLRVGAGGAAGPCTRHAARAGAAPPGRPAAPGDVRRRGAR